MDGELFKSGVQLDFLLVAILHDFFVPLMVFYGGHLWHVVKTSDDTQHMASNIS